MSVIIDIKNVVKIYKIYDNPVHRLKEALSIRKKKFYTEFKALNGISFQVNRGDALGILGKNGSGKSTLLKIITGVLTPTDGDIAVRGKVSAILELGAGFNPDYTGRENIMLNGTMMGFSEEEMKSRMQQIIEFADIGQFIDQPVKVYSSGMFARLAFAVSINVDPDILIVDEALAVGDIRFQTKCINKMKELKENGTTILFVSHATEQVKRFCNKAIWIKNGNVEASGESSEVVDLYEDYMKYEHVKSDKLEVSDVLEQSNEDNNFVIPSNPDIIASITNVEINNEMLKTFDPLEVTIEYEIYQKEIEGFLLGVAIYTPDREYVFGPNTHLENISIPNGIGRHKVKYTIPKLQLLGGKYGVDVGIFNNEGIVCLEYKQEIHTFQVTNKYFSEGKFYMDHRWDVMK
ncbi:ABC transporter ATP-binding protein [Paenibacillus arenosi]|uniref:ABC transporter ATP-binding protein n=1 Tax=Paenibacillus arenosi TaxID=2774142 RepID=A0ABR9B4T2_9BACL|nr:ABC transporter ATP-binding protein [Paenibacillus arenosi]MBD8500993.1 ABC transporter ATP-binding protein [Paenibacillus arenosi]